MGKDCNLPFLSTLIATFRESNILTRIFTAKLFCSYGTGLRRSLTQGLLE